MILAEECPGFKYYIPATRTRTGEPQNIHESIKEGPPSEGFHKDFYWIVKVGDPWGDQGTHSSYSRLERRRFRRIFHGSFENQLA